MKRKMAKEIVKQLEQKHGPSLTVREVRKMKKVKSLRKEGLEIFSVQKGDVTFLVWLTDKVVKIKIITW